MGRRRGQPVWGGGAGGAGAAGATGRGGMRAAHGLCAALALLLLPSGGRALRDGDCEGECGRARPAGTAGGGRSSPPSPAVWPVREVVGPGRGAALGLWQPRVTARSPGLGRAGPAGALPPAAGKVSEVWLSADGPGRAPLAGDRCRGDAPGCPRGRRGGVSSRAPRQGRDLPSEGTALCREVAGPSPRASGSVESPRERAATTPGDRTVSRDQHCRGSALAGQRSRRLSLPGDGDQAGSRTPVRLLTRDSPLAITVLRSARSPLGAHSQKP